MAWPKRGPRYFNVFGYFLHYKMRYIREGISSMDKSEKLYIVIPAYNEEETIPDVVNDWYPIVEKIGKESRLVIIDDGSKDHTHDILTKLSESRKQMVVLHKKNGGHGDTVLYGYQYAIKQHASYIFQTDSDGQTRSSEFAQFWKLRHQYHMVIGHRNKRQDGISRVFVTKTLQVVCFLCFHVWLKDANTPFRLMEVKSLKTIMKYIPEGYNLPNVAISALYTKKGYKVKYIPITFLPRQGGVNSINLKKIAKIGEKAVGDFIKIRKGLRK